MKSLSLKLKDDVFMEVEKVVHRIKMPRNAYINRALAFYNQLYKRRLLKEQLKKESKAVSPVSLEVLHEFEKIEGAEGL